MQCYGTALGDVHESGDVREDRVDGYKIFWVREWRMLDIAGDNILGIITNLVFGLNSSFCFREERRYYGLVLSLTFCTLCGTGIFRGLRKIIN